MAMAGLILATFAMSLDGTIIGTLGSLDSLSYLLSDHISRMINLKTHSTNSCRRPFKGQSRLIQLIHD